MERILSQEEIAELLSAVNHGDAGTDSQPIKIDSAPTVRRLDLTQTHAANQLRINNFDRFVDSFARNYSATLTKRLRQPLTIERSSMKAGDCATLLKSFPVAAAIGVFKVEPFRGRVLLVLDADLSFELIEILLGGGNRYRKNQPDRPLTDIELNILRELVSQAALAISRSIDDQPDVQIRLSEFFSNSRPLPNFPAVTMTVAASLEVNLAESRGKMHLVLPTSILEPLRDRVLTGHEQYQGHTGIWGVNLRKNLNTVPLKISAELGQIELTVQDFINFQVGDTIDLPWKTAENLMVRIEDRLKFRGLVGVRNGNKAVRISGLYQEGADYENEY